MTGSGKTTLANELSEMHNNIPIFHADDFFLLPELRTEERLNEPGGNIHYERMKAEVKRAEKDREELSQQYKEMEKQCAEVENSVFDLQMENIQLKSELEKLSNDG